jgi:hypothetical protein
MIFSIQKVLWKTDCQRSPLQKLFAKTLMHYMQV